MAVVCMMFVSPAAAQTERVSEVNIYFGKANGGAEGVSFPRGTAFGVELENQINDYLTMGFGFRHESTGVVRATGSEAHISRTYFGGVTKFYPAKRGRVRPYGLFGMGLGGNKFHINGRSQSQNSTMISLGCGVKFDLTKKWSIGPEWTLAYSGGARDYYGNKVGGGVTSKALWFGVSYNLSAQ
ncbi:MAG: hypothetical protein A2945_00635 [Candidatus Liptonbacteria bacterium RIFCSPLOWO2_01_FULL_52_25]|uniref:Outer membrane protein beta-barrel domain-containing protein n=1 Tax=Candidatus Liptonbacteria bacterium RIFCSPLOWO2_01_FULL_52_25 TaxID=1798650 RepID=A0A1G2CFJ9_9BACT|nr:MAG: hypothetical protein A2945_00635 [Candidatus Liptonbacteria bacterium RIFCSPLOWO2_01_FULL_52_25]